MVAVGPCVHTHGESLFRHVVLEDIRQVDLATGRLLSIPLRGQQVLALKLGDGSVARQSGSCYKNLYREI